MVIECIGSLVILNILLAGWVFIDSQPRQATIAWTLGAVLAGPILMPVYRARRPLKGGEIRAGGPDWIVARNFALTWTAVMAVMCFWVAVSIITERGLPDFESESSQNAANISRLLVLLFLSVCWLVPVGAALFYSIISFMDDDVQYGPDADPGLQQG